MKQAEIRGTYKGRPFGPTKGDGRVNGGNSYKESAPQLSPDEILARAREETQAVFTAVDVTKIMLRVAERDRITAKLRDDAQGLLLEQWLRKKARQACGRESQNTGSHCRLNSGHTGRCEFRDPAGYPFWETPTQ